MNVFVLCAGRSGSLAFARACRHVTNYSSAHESRIKCGGPDRLAYPDNHIEVDNRLSWFLGRLDLAYGDTAFYVHLRRDWHATAESWSKRFQIESGVMRAYATCVGRFVSGESELEVATDYVETTSRNIELFLRGRPRQITIEIERAAEAFPDFWRKIGAEGDLAAAKAEFLIRHNAS